MDETIKHRRVLISPLNWGLGHATRLIPIIEGLLDKKHEVIIAGEGASLAILKDAFPALKSIELKGFNIQLSKHQSQWFKLLIQIPALLKSIRKDYKATQLIIAQYNIDLIISDNRYGLFSSKIASVIITHQTHPYIGKKLAFLRPITNFISKKLIKQFDECWIPDTQSQPKLSGTLSNPIKGISSKYIGLTSRLSNATTGEEIHCDILIILSGPEPQRTILQDTLISQLKTSHYKSIILGAQPGASNKQIGNITVMPHCTATMQKQLITNSTHIICRSGYSTLMDLLTCQKRALLIPTPGQFEQEYLAEHVSKHFGFSSINQNQLLTSSIEVFLPLLENNTPFCGASLSLPTLPITKKSTASNLI